MRPRARLAKAVAMAQAFPCSATVLSMPFWFSLLFDFPSLLLSKFSFVGDCGKEPDEKNLMNLYGEFGLHEFSPSELVATHTCGDERFARSKLFGTGKHYPRPMR